MSDSLRRRKQSQAEQDAESFAFPNEIPIDAAHTLEQLTSRFRSIKDGLPELIKNCKDQYSRHHVVERSDRQIVVFANTEMRRLAVLDFAGARSSDFAGWTTWSSRTAGRQDLADDIEAGHGNGGKAFMVRGATEFAFLESCFEGLRTKMGFQNDAPSDRYKPGFARENKVAVNNVSEKGVEARLASFLAQIGGDLNILPAKAREAFSKRGAFTGVMMSKVVEWDGIQRRKARRLAGLLPDLIASHGQTAMSIETCEVWVIIDNSAPIGPLSIQPLEPYSGFEGPFEHAIPDVLPDPETGDLVSTEIADSGPKYLVLNTSARQLQLSDDTKARNVLRVWNARNNVATWPMHSLGVFVSAVNFLYGEIRCPALQGEHLAGADRIHLSDTPLTRAIREWTRSKVEELAHELHTAMMAQNKPKEREQAKAALRSIRELMRRFLDPDSVGDSADEERQLTGGRGSSGAGEQPQPPKIQYGERIDEIVLEAGLSALAQALGTAAPLHYKAYEIQFDGTKKPVKPHGIRLQTSVPDVASLLDGRLQANVAGKFDLWVESADGTIKSNSISYEVVTASDVDIKAIDEPLLQGQRTKLATTFLTPDGPREDLLVDGSIDEAGMGLLSRNGRFTAGYKEGQATVRIRFGAAPHQNRSAQLLIGEAKVPPPEGRGGHGSDIPEILLCGETAPGMEDVPEDQRTVPGGESLPTIIEDELFPHVVWINPQSKEAMRVRSSRGGTSGVGSISSKTFMNFVALKCFDVLKRLHVRQALKGKTVTEYEFIQLAAYAEIECADFIDAAWEMSDQLISKGDADVGGKI